MVRTHHEKGPHLPHKEFQLPRATRSTWTWFHRPGRDNDGSFFWSFWFFETFWNHHPHQFQFFLEFLKHFETTKNSSVSFHLTLLVGTSSCGLKKSLTMKMPILLTIPGKRLKIKGKRDLDPWRFIFPVSHSFPVSHGHFFCMPWEKNPDSPMICSFLYPIFVAWQKIPSISRHAHVFLRYSPYNHPMIYCWNTFSKLLLTSPLSHKMSINIPSNHQKKNDPIKYPLVN